MVAFLFLTHADGSAAARYAKGIRTACSLYASGYAALAAFRLCVKQRTEETDGQVAERRRRTKIAAVYVASTAAAGTAIAGAACFLRFPRVPIWAPVAAAASSLIVYIKRSRAHLFRDSNNERLPEHAVVLGSAAFFGGWAAGPLVHFFSDFLLGLFAPVSLSTMLGFAAAVQVAENPYLLVIHGPSAALSFAGSGVLQGLMQPSRSVGDGGGGVLAGAQQNWSEAGKGAAGLSIALAGTLCLHVHYALCFSRSSWSFFRKYLNKWVSAGSAAVLPEETSNEDVDIATHAFLLTTAGAGVVYRCLRSLVAAQMRVVRRLAGDQPTKPKPGIVSKALSQLPWSHDDVGVAAASAAMLGYLYFRTVAKVRAAQAPSAVLE